MLRAAHTPERQVRIVVADDHSVVRYGLRLLLEVEPGLDVVAEAGDAEETVELVQTHRPDVLVLDLGLPGDSGVDLIARIIKEAPETRVLVFTVQREPMFARRALGAGAVGYVLKDAANSELVSAVRSVASGETYLDPQLGASFANDTRRPSDLTEREVEILRLIALGYTNPEIASRMYLSVRTIEAHRMHIHQKLQLSSRAELVRFALEHRLVELPPPER
jgi:two-component system, NarL family, response regulator NreC